MYLREQKPLCFMLTTLKWNTVTTHTKLLTHKLTCGLNSVWQRLTHNFINKYKDTHVDSKGKRNSKHDCSSWGEGGHFIVI